MSERLNIQYAQPILGAITAELPGKPVLIKKRSMQHKAKEWHDITVTDDEADAIGIGKYVADLLFNIQVTNWE